MANNLNDEIGIVQERPVRDAVGPNHLADVAEVVAVVAAEVDVVLAGVAGVTHGQAVALIELELVDAPVFHCEAATEQVVSGVYAQDFQGGELPDAADGYGDVRDSRLVDDAQLLARRAVDVLRHAAVTVILHVHLLIPIFFL